MTTEGIWDRRKLLAISLMIIGFFATTATEVSANGKAGALAYESGDYATAFREFTEAAKRGNAHSQAFLGIMFSNGQGVAQSFVEAEKWFRKAADQGLAVAQIRLGWLYSKGQGVVKKNIMRQRFGIAKLQRRVTQMVNIAWVCHSIMGLA